MLGGPPPPPKVIAEVRLVDGVERTEAACPSHRPQDATTAPARGGKGRVPGPPVAFGGRFQAYVSVLAGLPLCDQGGAVYSRAVPTMVPTSPRPSGSPGDGAAARAAR